MTREVAERGKGLRLRTVTKRQSRTHVHQNGSQGQTTSMRLINEEIQASS
jgi:hypothetical protein